MMCVLFKLSLINSHTQKHSVLKQNSIEDAYYTIYYINTSFLLFLVYHHDIEFTKITKILKKGYHTKIFIHFIIAY